MYGAVPPKSKVTARKPDDHTVEMQPLMVDPYFDKNFAPEVSFLFSQSMHPPQKCSHLLSMIVCTQPSTFSSFKIAAVISVVCLILVIGIAVSSRGEPQEMSQTEKTDPFYVNKLTKMMMPNGWIRLRAATTATSSYTKPTGYIYLSQYEYGGDSCDEESLQIQHGTVTGVCVAGQDVYGDMSTSGVYTCSEKNDKVIWELEHFNSTDCTGDSLKVYKYEYPSGCSVGDKIDSKYVFQAGCSKTADKAPYNDVKAAGYLLGSAITDAKCDTGDEFYYSWVKTNACLKGLDDGQGSRKFTDCSGMAVTVSLYSDPECAKEEYSSVTSFECDVTDDYFYYYYDDNSGEDGATANAALPSDDAAKVDDDDKHIVDDDGTENYSGNVTYYADDAEDDKNTGDDDPSDDTPVAGKPKKPKPAAAPTASSSWFGRRKLLEEYTLFKKSQRNQMDHTRQLRTDDTDDKGDDDDGERVAKTPAPSAEDDDTSNNDDLAIFRNFVFGKCMIDGKEDLTKPPTTPAPTGASASTSSVVATSTPQ